MEGVVLVRLVGVWLPHLGSVDDWILVVRWHGEMLFERLTGKASSLLRGDYGEIVIPPLGYSAVISVLDKSFHLLEAIILLHIIRYQLQGSSIRFPHILAIALKRKRYYIIGKTQLLIFPISQSS